VPAQRVQRLAFVELAVDPGSEQGVCAVAQQKVRTDDPAVHAERDSDGGLGGDVLQARDQEAGRDPAALERRGRSQEVVVLLDDPCRPGPGSQDDVDGEAGGFAEEVEAEIAGVA
jgi:hypothetical protein